MYIVYMYMYVLLCIYSTYMYMYNVHVYTQCTVSSSMGLYTTENKPLQLIFIGCELMYACIHVNVHVHVHVYLQMYIYNMYFYILEGFDDALEYKHHVTVK